MYTLRFTCYTLEISNFCERMHEYELRNRIYVNTNASQISEQKMLNQSSALLAVHELRGRRPSEIEP